HSENSNAGKSTNVLRQLQVDEVQHLGCRQRRSLGTQTVAAKTNRFEAGFQRMVYFLPREVSFRPYQYTISTAARGLLHQMLRIIQVRSGNEALRFLCCAEKVGKGNESTDFRQGGAKGLFHGADGNLLQSLGPDGSSFAVSAP